MPFGIPHWLTEFIFFELGWVLAVFVVNIHIHFNECVFFLHSDYLFPFVVTTLYHIMGDLSIGKMHKDSSQNLCNLPIDKNAGRVGRARAVRKTEKTPTLRSRSLIRKEVNISEMLVRVVGSRTPRFTRQCVLPPDCTHIFKGVECGRICTPIKPLFRRLALLVSHTLIYLKVRLFYWHSLSTLTECLSTRFDVREVFSLSPYILIIP